jgi:hypothetical protein
MNTIAIYESKKSEKIVKFVTAEQLLELTNKRYAKKLIEALENNLLYGTYITKTGRLKATFI